ncbi:hypothetical protein D9M70_579610 [compost metagenome]
MRVELSSFEQADAFKLCNDAIDRGQADIAAVRNETAVDVRRAHVQARMLVEDVEDLHPGEGGLDAGMAQQ